MKRTIWSVLGLGRVRRPQPPNGAGPGARWNGLAMWVLLVPALGAALLGGPGCGTGDSVMSSAIVEPTDSDLSASDAGAREYDGVGGSASSGFVKFAEPDAELILPQEGGELESGKFSLTVPANALPTPALYTVTPYNTAEAMVALGPHGAEFGESVTLVIDLRGTSIARGIGRAQDVDGDGINLYWWDPAVGQWVNVGGSYDAVTQQLTTTLEHFSTYRAGW